VREDSSGEAQAQIRGEEVMMIIAFAIIYLLLFSFTLNALNVEDETGLHPFPKALFCAILWPFFLPLATLMTIIERLQIRKMIRAEKRRAKVS
jgi:hypothetical protein